MSIKKVLQDAHRLAVLSADELKKLEADLSTSIPVAEKVKLLRSNLYAHRVRYRSVKEIYDEAGITPNQIRDLVTVTFSIANAIAFKLGSQDWKLESATLSGFKCLIGEGS
jgi:hypothetical protein